MSKLGMVANNPGTQEAEEFKASLGYRKKMGMRETERQNGSLDH